MAQRRADCTSPAKSATGISAPATRSTASTRPYPNGIPYKSYTTWNLGVGWTYKVFTVDLRYIDTDLNKGDCNAFTSDHTASGPGTSVTAINPGGFGSNWCGARFVARLSADLTVEHQPQVSSD